MRSFHSEARWGQQEPCRFQWLVYNRCAPWNSQELMIFFLHRQCGWSTLHADPCLARLGPLMVFVGYQVLAFCDWQRRRCVPGVPGVPLRHVPSIPSCSWKVWEFGSAVFRNFLLRVLHMEATDGCLWLCGLPNQSQMHSLWNCVFFFQRMSLSLLFLLHFHLPHKWMSQLKRNSNNIPLKNLGLSQNWFQWIWNDSQLASNNSQIIFNIVSNSVN